ncbi:MAG: adenylosuccinate synthetase, partial [Planctomycetes bacterium]|nr:adenylosuccinate synthetase [Planctomycetota bacterium]
LAGTNSWVMTKLDVLSGFEEIRVGVAYLYGGERFEDYPAHLPGLEGIEVEYRSFPGWKEDISGVREWEDLPEKAREYVKAMGDLVGAPVRLVSVGPDREAMVTVP